MKKLIIALAIMLLPGAVALAQTPTQTPLTKEQIEIALKNTTAEKEYLQAKVRILELQVQEQNLQQALENLKKKEGTKAESKKEEKKAK